MLTVYLVRHAQTEWNRAGRIQGWAYTSLTETGRQQARALRAYLLDHIEQLDAIYTSDLPRATETAAILTDHDRTTGCPVTELQALRERDFGVYQGFQSDGFFQRYPEFSIVDHGMAAANRTPEQGESYVTFDCRVQTAWQELRTQHGEGAETIIVVTHGGVITRIVGTIVGLGYEDAIKTVVAPNASVTKLTIDGDHQHIQYRSRDSFLPD